jgi:hypothetical protein
VVVEEEEELVMVREETRETDWLAEYTSMCWLQMYVCSCCGARGSLSVDD